MSNDEIIKFWNFAAQSIKNANADTLETSVSNKHIFNAVRVLNHQKSEIEFLKGELEKLKEPRMVNIVHARHNVKSYALYRELYNAGIQDFAHFLIDKAVDGCIHISDIPDYVSEFNDEE